ncbi:hypothetical protein CLIB1423_08S00628 [[Candida] railenensis]|uniref:pH-response transcription factor pacC/RIM101 n=1 Tax=[Candida] railenensis TaxID=45579 RepID=A0A9P0QQE9_9ASCO|nr:hypothetical protein CLIB1423_08S00628 [[Candida] railenensis]
MEDYNSSLMSGAGSSSASGSSGNTSGGNAAGGSFNFTNPDPINFNDEIFFNVSESNQLTSSSSLVQSSNTANTTPEFHTPPAIDSNNYDYMNKRVHSNSFSLPIDQLNLLTLRQDLRQEAEILGANGGPGSASSGSGSAPGTAVVSISHSPSPNLNMDEFPSSSVYQSLVKENSEERTINPRQLFNDHKPLSNSYSSPSLTTLFKSEIQLSSQNKNKKSELYGNKEKKQNRQDQEQLYHQQQQLQHQEQLKHQQQHLYNQQHQQQQQQQQQSPQSQSQSQTQSNVKGSTPRFDFIMNDECFNAIHYWLNNTQFSDATGDSAAEIIGNPTGIMKYQRRRNSIQLSSSGPASEKISNTISKKKRRKSYNNYELLRGNIEGLGIVNGKNKLKDEKKYRAQLESIQSSNQNENQSELQTQDEADNLEQVSINPEDLDDVSVQLSSNGASILSHQLPSQEVDPIDTESAPIKSPTLLKSQQFQELSEQRLQQQQLQTTPQSAQLPQFQSPPQVSPTTYTSPPFQLQSQQPQLLSQSQALRAPAQSSAKVSTSPKSKPAHQSDDEDSDEEKPFPCPDCTKQFKRSEHLKRHIRSVHSNIRPFHCKYCEKKFSRSDNLAQHLKTHYKTLPNGTTTIILGNPNLFNRGGRRNKS